MPTSAQDRFNKLFENQERPTPPDPVGPQTEGPEIGDQHTANQEPWKIPETAQYPKIIPRQASNASRDIDQLASSDEEDDYIAAFKKKPQMGWEKSKLKRHILPQQGLSSHRKSGQLKSWGAPYDILNAKQEVQSTGAPLTGEGNVPKNEEPASTDPFGNPSTGHFCVLNLVAKFPYKYMVDTNGEVSQRFFANSKFYNRTWDVHYLYPPLWLSYKPLLLLPYNQVFQLIEDIGQTFQIEVAVPAEPFTMSFFDDGTPQPQFLGTCSSREEFARLQDSIPPVPLDHGKLPANPSAKLEYSFEAWQEKCEKAFSATKKTKASIKKKQNDRLIQTRDGLDQLKRAQCYLGLRPRSIKLTGPEPDPTVSRDGQEAFQERKQKESDIRLNPLNVGECAPHPFEKEPVIISVDVESYERAHHLITEVGISTLDTCDLADIAPGEGGQNWMTQIRSRHFRIREYQMLINKDFCLGNPEAFQFGESEIVSLADAAAAVDACFQPPYSAPFKHEGELKHLDFIQDTDQSRLSKKKSLKDDPVDVQGPTNEEHGKTNEVVSRNLLGSTHESDCPDSRSADIAQPATAEDTNAPLHAIEDRASEESEQRHIILLGHDIGADLLYLEKLGSAIFKPRRSTYPIAAMEVIGSGSSKDASTLASIIEALDTAVLYRAMKCENQNRSLQRVLLDLGRCGWFLHNAGNDARYTLEAFIALVIKARLTDDETGGRLGMYPESSTSQHRRTKQYGYDGQGDLEREKATRIVERVKIARYEAEQECKVCETAGDARTRLTIEGSGEREESATETDVLKREHDLTGLSGDITFKGVFATSLPIMPKPKERREDEYPNELANRRGFGDDKDGCLPSQSFADQSFAMGG